MDIQGNDTMYSKQLIGVVRHAERVDASWSGTDSWQFSEDFRKFPADPPLSERGFVQAKEIGETVQEWVKEHKEHLHHMLAVHTLCADGCFDLQGAWFTYANHHRLRTCRGAKSGHPW
jgi:hypothetical protein